MLGDCIGVIYDGRLSGVVKRDEADMTKIGLLMAGIQEATA